MKFENYFDKEYLDNKTECISSKMRIPSGSSCFIANFVVILMYLHISFLIKVQMHKCVC